MSARAVLSPMARFFIVSLVVPAAVLGDLAGDSLMQKQVARAHARSIAEPPSDEGLELLSKSDVKTVVRPWGQCGGRNYKGNEKCSSGYECAEVNKDYFQCEPMSEEVLPEPAAAPEGAEEEDGTTEAGSSPPKIVSQQPGWLCKILHMYCPKDDDVGEAAGSDASPKRTTAEPRHDDLGPQPAMDIVDDPEAKIVEPRPDDSGTAPAMDINAASSDEVDDAGDDDVEDEDDDDDDLGAQPAMDIDAQDNKIVEPRHDDLGPQPAMDIVDKPVWSHAPTVPAMDINAASSDEVDDAGDDDVEDEDEEGDEEEEDRDEEPEDNEPDDNESEDTQPEENEPEDGEADEQGGRS